MQEYAGEICLGEDIYEELTLQSFCDFATFLDRPYRALATFASSCQPLAVTLQ